MRVKVDGVKDIFVDQVCHYSRKTVPDGTAMLNNPDKNGVIIKY